MSENVSGVKSKIVNARNMIKSRCVFVARNVFLSDLRVMSNIDSATAVSFMHWSDHVSIGEMKARQCAKIAELRKILEQAGYRTISKQAVVLGLSRSTTWAILKANHKSSGISGSIIKRMLRSPDLPPVARQWIDEYVAEKLAGKYGHRRNRSSRTGGWCGASFATRGKLRLHSRP